MTFWILPAYCAAAAFTVYILIFGQSEFHRRGIVGKLHGILTRLPDTCGINCLSFIFCSRQKGSQRWRVVSSYFSDRPNPALQIFYLFLTLTCMYFYLTKSVPLLSTNAERVFARVYCACALLSFFIACKADPGTVYSAQQIEKIQTKKNNTSIKSMRSYLDAQLTWNKTQNEKFEGDGFLYREGVGSRISSTFCSSCEVPRPARSKHCRICGRCVRKFDHHCAWLNTDVGENNFRFFLLYLLMHWTLAIYIVLTSCIALVNVALQKRVFEAYFVDAEGKRHAPTTYMIINYLAYSNLAITCVIVFTAFVAVMLFIFWAHHSWCALRNITTNERHKITDLMEYLEDVRSYQTFCREGRQEERKQQTGKHNHEDNGETKAAAADDLEAAHRLTTVFCSPLVESSPLFHSYDDQQKPTTKGMEILKELDKHILRPSFVDEPLLLQLIQYYSRQQLPRKAEEEGEEDVRNKGSNKKNIEKKLSQTRKNLSLILRHTYYQSYWNSFWEVALPDEIGKSMKKRKSNEEVIGSVKRMKHLVTTADSGESQSNISSFSPSNKGGQNASTGKGQKESKKSR